MYKLVVIPKPAKWMGCFGMEEREGVCVWGGDSCLELSPEFPFPGSVAFVAVSHQW